MVNTVERFSFLERINNIRLSKEREAGADQYKLWLAQYCGALRFRLVTQSKAAYTREQNQRALLVGIGMEEPVIALELKIFQDWIHNNRT